MLRYLVMNNPRKIDWTDVLLRVISLSRLMTMAIVAPNAIQYLPKLGFFGKSKFYGYSVNRAVKRLADDRFIEFIKNEQGVNCIRLTEKGRQTLKKYELKSLEIKKPRRWDGKYRVIIFDIKEYKRQTRDKLRSWLYHLGFVRLQNSVWVNPYECQEVVVLLKSYFQIGKEVLYLTVESIENDSWLKKVFALK